LNSLIFKYLTDLNKEFTGEMEVEESDNMQLEEGEVQPEQGSAPQKERQKGIRIPKVPGRNIPSNRENKFKRKIIRN